MKMKIEIIKKLENNYVTRYTKAVLKFKIKNSILKTHFKELMRLAKMYDSKEKSGFISKDNQESFLNLVERIEASDNNKCKKSHQKSIQRKIERNQQFSNTMSFEDYCEEFLDQHVALMNDEHKNEAYQAYLSH